MTTQQAIQALQKLSAWMRDGNDDSEQPITSSEAVAALDVVLRAVIQSERRAITFGDLVSMQTSAMRAAIVDAELRGPDAGLRWIANTLSGPGHLPDVEAAKAEGGAQAMFDREVRELEEFRSAHPAPEPPQ